MKASDFALAKTTKVTEKLNVQFRMETFNTFNRFQAAAPASLAVGNGNFGKVTAIANVLAQCYAAEGAGKPSTQSIL